MFDISNGIGTAFVAVLLTGLFLGAMVGIAASLWCF